MTRRIPTVRNGTLHEHIEEVPSIDAIVVGSAAWYTWLENHSTFRFDHPFSSFTARKEQRSGGWYWYAYRRQAGRLRTAYVGRSAELSITRLEVIAADLAGVSTHETCICLLAIMCQPHTFQYSLSQKSSSSQAITCRSNSPR